jgi:hypothetical protein
LKFSKFSIAAAIPPRRINSVPARRIALPRLSFAQVSRLRAIEPCNQAASGKLVACCERQQCNVPRLLDGARQPPLVRGADTGQPPRHNLAALSHKLLQQPYVAIRNRIDLFRAELADLLAAEELATSAGSTRTTASTTRAGARSRSWP